MNNFAGAETSIANAFFQQYFLSITQDIFYVLTDADHKSGFKLQSLLLARLFELVEMNQIQAPLYDPTTVPTPNMSNSVFLREYCANLLKSAFPHMQLYVTFTLFTYFCVLTILFSVLKFKVSFSASVNYIAISTHSSSRYVISSLHLRSSLGITRSFSSKRRKRRRRRKPKKNETLQCAFLECSNHRKSRTRMKTYEASSQNSLKTFSPHIAHALQCNLCILTAFCHSCRCRTH